MLIAVITQQITTTVMLVNRSSITTNLAPTFAIMADESESHTGGAYLRVIRVIRFTINVSRFARLKWLLELL